MTFPANGPVTRDQVKAHLQITDDNDDAALAVVVAAVNARVVTWPAFAPFDTDPATLADWNDPRVADLVLGSVMLAARLFLRRNSAAGVSAFGDAGPVYVSRNDPDVALLLRLGSYTRPAVG